MQDYGYPDELQEDFESPDPVAEAELGDRVVALEEPSEIDDD